MISRIAKLIQEYEQTLQDAISLADIFKRNPILVERFVDAVAGSIGFVEAKEAKEAKGTNVVVELLCVFFLDKLAFP